MQELRLRGWMLYTEVVYLDITTHLWGKPRYKYRESNRIRTKENLWFVQ